MNPDARYMYRYAEEVRCSISPVRKTRLKELMMRLFCLGVIGFISMEQDT
jgi:hypothetical protein